MNTTPRATPKSEMERIAAPANAFIGTAKVVHLSHAIKVEQQRDELAEVMKLVCQDAMQINQDWLMRHQSRSASEAVGRITERSAKALASLKQP